MLNKCALKKMGKDALVGIGVLTLIYLLIELFLFLARKYFENNHSDAVVYLLVWPSVTIFTLMFVIGGTQEWYNSCEKKCKEKK